jgi:DNA-nicking Smr family endonuclease
MTKRRDRSGVEDAALWHAYAREVKPLGARPPARARKPALAERTRPPDPAERPAPARRAPLPELEAGAAADLDRRTMDRLRRGQLRPEAALDLHGMTRKEAHAALGRFVAGAQADGKRALLVVTGRGGVLREEVPKWLNAPALRPRMLGFASAQPRDGGPGAIYVLLRRDRRRGAAP